MPGRQLLFENGGYYHVFNRGVAKLPIFLSQKDYAQAMQAFGYYLSVSPPMKLSRFKELSVRRQEDLVATQLQNNDSLVNVIAFAFMPNHFHMLLQQVVDRGIARYMSKFQNSYSRYFNTKHNRVGALFQGVFKAVYVESEEQLLHLTRYIHLNPVIASIVKKEELDRYPWTSFGDYMKNKSVFISQQFVLSMVKTPEAYKKFVFDYIDYAQRLAQMKHVLLDEP